MVGFQIMRILQNLLERPCRTCRSLTKGFPIFPNLLKKELSELSVPYKKENRKTGTCKKECSTLELSGLSAPYKKGKFFDLPAIRQTLPFQFR